MSSVSLLNDTGKDPKASREICEALEQEVAAASEALTSRCVATYDEYLRLWTRLETARRHLELAEKIFGRNFKI